MDKKLQTKEWFNNLRKMTIKYVRIYVNKCYKQYQQYNYTIEDLAMEFITDWLTPKDGRHHDREPKSWVDTFDPETMNLDTCVKVMVIRKLIDKSRLDKKRLYSLDKYIEDKGESFFTLDSLLSKNFDFRYKDVAESAKKFDGLGVAAKNKLINEYFIVRDGISPEGRNFFDSVFGVKPMQVRVFNSSETTELESMSVYVNNHEVRFDDRSDLRRCFVNSIDRNSILVCLDGELVPFDKSSGVDRISGNYSIASKDLMRCSEIRRWKYDLVPTEEFTEFCDTLR